MSDQKKATYQIQPFPSLQPSAAMLDRKELCTASCAAVGNMWDAAACAELAAHRAGCAQSWQRTAGAIPRFPWGFVNCFSAGILTGLASGMRTVGRAQAISLDSKRPIGRP